jgi:hypothetical protein
MNIIAGLVISLLLINCGGGNQLAEGGIGGTGISTGSITGFGSVWVNGVEFSTAGAKIIEEDDEAGAIPLNTDDSDDVTELAPYLSEGMVVTIKGTINDDGVTGVAETIYYEDLLEGPVAGNPGAGATSFIALGQTIHVTIETVYGGGLTGIADIMDNQVVEVSGFRETNGEIQALYIEKIADTYQPADEFELKGIASVNSAYELQIGGLKVSTSGIGQVVVDFADEYVQVKGTFDGSDLLTTSENVVIENESFDGSDLDIDGYKAELEGIASTACGATAPCTFLLSGVTISVETSTQISGSGGSSAADIVAGSKAHVKGIMQGGMLIANEIEIQ